MLSYYLHLGLRSLRRNPVLTGLMVMAIGFGVAASMTTYSIFRAVSGNPIPDKSAQLFTPQVDGWGPQQNIKGEPPAALSYTDAMALQRAHKAKRLTLLYGMSMSVVPESSNSLPFAANGYAVTGDFFSMFEVPFLYGDGWDSGADDGRAATVVLSEEFNRKIFGGANSVGREVTLDGHGYRVVGVTRHWDPKPRFFALFNGSPFQQPTDFYLPFNRAVDMQVSPNGSSCRGHLNFSGWDDWMHSICVWVTPWVELDNATDVTSYQKFLEAYAADQQHAGRFAWAPNVRLRDVMQWLDFQQVVPPESRISLLLALGFFVICLVNTIGLLLAKFLRRASEIGVRRALGASRRQVYVQYLMEAGTVGLAGGVLGLLLTAAGVSGVGLLFTPEIARLAHLDLSLIALTLLVAVFATMAAAFYPAWRAAQVQPAWQLKSN
ncbi:ABC transporter permease [Rhodanobacter sp. L36]|uniref:ABC transporter permease n=1 Tax=Rhodanobacter sp. L36 TaxID=1747221 RepID=UPI00131DE2B2|nr:ABC transporter permease [Rhodanobacter sp. L36]